MKPNISTGKGNFWVRGDIIIRKKRFEIAQTSREEDR